MAITADIYNLFSKIAETHPIIGHQPNANPPINHFYGFSLDETISGSVDNSFFPCLGLSKNTHAPLSGAYKYTGTDALKNNSFSVLLLDTVEQNNYESEAATYDRMESVMDDIVSWLFNKIAGGDQCDFELLEMIDADKIYFNRVGPLTTANAFGWEIVFTFKNTVEFTSANPLKNMTP